MRDVRPDRFQHISLTVFSMTVSRVVNILPFRVLCITLFFFSCHLLGIANRTPAADEQSSQIEQFEKQIRPLLAARCFSCHGPDKQQGAVRLDLRQEVFTPGEAGLLVNPGHPDDSRLIQVIRYAPEDVQMPPDKKLPEAEIALLTAWIKGGAQWPEDAPAGSPLAPILKTASGEVDFLAEATRHWAYRPLHPITPPPFPATTSDQSTAATRIASHTELDAFILQKQSAVQLTLSPLADRRTLIRRASIDLLGVLPTFAEVEAFAQDERPEAYAELLDRLLASPLYGQRWGRHWLDVARYADTKGYVFTENRFFPFSYTYRDYVIRSLNDDKPYDRFLQEQLAADQLGMAEHDPDLAAMGFLTVGRRFLNNSHDIIDDRIDLVTRGLMGMTVACARCHDHKYDPVPAADYYSLYGVFASAEEPEEPPLIGTPPEGPGYQKYLAELSTRQKAVDDYVAKTRDEILTNLRTGVGDQLLGVVRDSKTLPDGTEIPFAKKNPSDKQIQHWKAWMDRRIQQRDPVFRPWSELAAIPHKEFADKSSAILQRLANESDDKPEKNSPRRANQRVVNLLMQAAPKSMLDVAKAYGELFQQVDAEWQKLQQEAPAEAASKPDKLEDEAAEQLRRVLYGEGSVTDVPVGQESRIYERNQRDKERELQKKVAEWQVTSPDAPPRAMTLQDRPQPHAPVIFLRGDANRRGDAVPRRAPRILTGPDGPPYKNGSGRLELAQLITSPENPLTARVMVNRVWDWHFSQPLVNTTSDFGKRSDPPTHPEMLDWLAWNFIHVDHWSLKKLHRRIMLSATYQQQSLDRPNARQVDPENRLYWRMNRRSLEFEAMRDSLLQVAGRLDTSLGGRPFDLDKNVHSNRRTVYALIDRNNFLSLLRTFDFPTPDVSSPGRTTTSVPQQTLFALNSEFVQRIAQDVTNRPEVAQAKSPAEQVQALYQIILQRGPAPEELSWAERFLATATGPNPLQQFSQALLVSNEFQFID
ncbi:MAG: PSD1 and planctomycete cytochrome C domain-containing protein [Planctomycetaceae bacterium]